MFHTVKELLQRIILVKILKKIYQKRKQKSDETYRKYRTIGTRKKTRLLEILK